MASNATPSNGGMERVEGEASRSGSGDLALRLMESAQQLHRQNDPDETLRAVVSAAVRLIPGAQEGSLSLVAAGRTLLTEAATSALAAEVDKLQEQVREGPCLDAVYEQHTIVVADTAQESRWPRFSALACEAGVGSILALQLFVDGDRLGALNLYARQSHAFDDDSLHVGQMFAAHAAIAYSTARRQVQLERAVHTRELIGQAQGILMERHKITSDQAFAVLVQASQHNNVKLRAVADRLVSTGSLTDDRPL